MKKRHNEFLSPCICHLQNKIFMSAKFGPPKNGRKLAENGHFGAKIGLNQNFILFWAYRGTVTCVKIFQFVAFCKCRVNEKASKVLTFLKYLTKQDLSIKYVVNWTNYFISNYRQCAGRNYHLFKTLVSRALCANARIQSESQVAFFIWRLETWNGFDVAWHSIHLLLHSRSLPNCMHEKNNFEKQPIIITLILSFQISMSTRQDDLLILHVNHSYDSLLQVSWFLTANSEVEQS